MKSKFQNWGKRKVERNQGEGKGSERAPKIGKKK